MMMKRTVLIALSTCLLGTLVSSADDKADPVNHLSNGVAIKGYDPVACFTDTRPVMGDPRFTQRWKGAVWQFASAAHRGLFAQNPEKYAPQYGGYCAYGVRRGNTVDIDPAAWKIVGGRLYLNYSSGVQEKFLKEPDRAFKPRIGIGRTFTSEGAR